MIRTLHIGPEGALTAGGAELMDRVPTCAPTEDGSLLWIDLEGQSEENRKLVSSMGFHPLAVEDTFTLAHQPKLEEYDDFLFVIVRGIDADLEQSRLVTLKLVAFLTPGRLVTFHRAPLHSVNTVYTRMSESKRAARGGLAHLLYLIYEEMIGYYLPRLEETDEALASLEAQIFIRPHEDHLAAILRHRRQLSALRQVMVPHRQIFIHLSTGSSELIDTQEALYFRDVYDEVMRLSEAIDMQREQLASARDTYLSVISQRTNEIMQVLTVLSAVLLPLTVIAGIYGMNFTHMPELQQAWGYPMALGLMALVAGGLLLFFKRKGWL